MVWVEKALDQQEIALGIFLDLEGVFKNTSSYNSMCAALARHGVGHTIIQWIRATLEGWLSMVIFGGFSRDVAMIRGCPKGRVLSPLLWCFVVNDLLARLNEGGVYSQGYADDIWLLAGGKIPKYSYQGSYSGPFIPLNCSVASSVCRLILTNLGLLHSPEKGNSQGSLNLVYLGRPCIAPC